jgi:trimethylamine:corrinoid methyltransferase-like protein
MFQAGLLTARCGSATTDDQIEPLADGVFTVLEQTGVLCQNEEILRALAAAGAEVDYAAERARFPRKMVAEFVEQLRRENPWRETTLLFGPPGLPGVGTQVAQFCHDYEAGERRSSCREDFILLTKLGDVLHREEGVGHSLAMTDVPPLLEPLEAGLLLAEYAHVPGPPFAWHVKQVDYLIEMGEIMGRENWFTYGAVCFAHPLRFDRDLAAKFVRRVREGAPTGIAAMPVAGVTTPVTVEGFVVVSTAEHVATWLAVRALNPECPLSGSMWAGTVDMKTGATSYSAFDAMFYAFAAVEFIRRWCGFDMPVGSGEYCDAKAPGLYTALEKAYKAMMVSAFTGQGIAAGTGLLDEGKLMSAVQLLLDR